MTIAINMYLHLDLPMARVLISKKIFPVDPKALISRALESLEVKTEEM